VLLAIYLDFPNTFDLYVVFLPMCAVEVIAACVFICILVMDLTVRRANMSLRSYKIALDLLLVTLPLSFFINHVLCCLWNYIGSFAILSFMLPVSNLYIIMLAYQYRTSFAVFFDSYCCCVANKNARRLQPVCPSPQINLVSVV